MYTFVWGLAHLETIMKWMNSASGKFRMLVKWAPLANLLHLRSASSHGDSAGRSKKW